MSSAYYWARWKRNPSEGSILIEPQWEIVEVIADWKQSQNFGIYSLTAYVYRIYDEGAYFPDQFEFGDKIEMNCCTKEGKQYVGQ